MRQRFQATRIVFLAALIELIFIVTPASADCLPDPGWLPKTPAPTFERPPPRPASDCGFYRPGWQIFLGATQNIASAQPYRPAFLDYPTIETMFGSGSAVFSKFSASKPGLLALAPRALKGSNDAQATVTTFSAGAPKLRGKLRDKAAEVNAGARQAGLGGLLVDQNGNPVFYAIHVNQTFADFIKTNFVKEDDAKTRAAIKAADPELTFPKGAIEYKSAWQIVPGGVDTPDYITARATVPILKVSSGSLVVDPSVDPREVLVRLLSLHVVFVLDGHPEFIWATFEHVDKDGGRDLAPAAKAMPAGDEGLPGGVDDAVNTKDFTLYKAGTLASVADTILDDAALIQAFDPATQSFTKGGTLQTSIFRRFPASKMSKSSLVNPDEDDDVVSLNGHMTDGFKAGSADDRRRNYRLVGAVWLDKPALSFQLKQPLRNPTGVTGDDADAVVVGEDGLSSMAMELFTQDLFVNCLACHDAQAVTNLQNETLLEAKKLNASHVLSRYLDGPK